MLGDQHTHVHTHTHTLTQARGLLSDFSIFTALTIMVIVAYLLRNLITVETLQVSSGFNPSNSTARSWFINPFDGKITLGQGFGALVPAMLVRICCCS